jgi:hypothetical protein
VAIPTSDREQCDRRVDGNAAQEIQAKKHRLRFHGKHIKLPEIWWMARDCVPQAWVRNRNKDHPNIRSFLLTAAMGLGELKGSGQHKRHASLEPKSILNIGFDERWWLRFFPH